MVVRIAKTKGQAYAIIVLGKDLALNHTIAEFLRWLIYPEGPIQRPVHGQRRRLQEDVRGLTNLSSHYLPLARSTRHVTSNIPNLPLIIIEGQQGSVDDILIGLDAAWI